MYGKVRSKSPPNRAPSPSCLHGDVTHLSLTTGIVALHIPSWRVREPEERRQARKTVLNQLMQEEWFIAIEIIYVESPITINMFEILFWKSKSQVET